MAQFVDTWSNKALQKFDCKALWYLANCGESFVKTFVADIEENINAIACVPSIGTKRKVTTTRTYRTFVNHPRCTIYYWHDSKQVHIIDLLFTNMAYRPYKV